MNEVGKMAAHRRFMLAARNYTDEIALNRSMLENKEMPGDMMGKCRCLDALLDEMIEALAEARK